MTDGSEGVTTEILLYEGMAWYKVGPDKVRQYP